MAFEIAITKSLLFSRPVVCASLYPPFGGGFLKANAKIIAFFYPAKFLSPFISAFTDPH